MQKLMIIDGNAIVHRAYHALPPLTTKDGKMVNAVYGFTSMLLKAWHDLKPTHIAVTFDMAGGTFRHTKFAKYKATRVRADQELYDQIPLAHEVVRAFGIPVFEKKGYEADDAIGTIAKEVKEKKDVEVFIVTGDMDTLQLIRPGLKIYALRKGMSDIVVYDKEEVKNKYGFGPEMMVDYKALRGDTSDNIPGVPGVGEKTATELIEKIGGIKKIYQELEKGNLEIKGFKPGVIKKLIEGRESAQMSFELATIDQNVPELNFHLKDCELKDFDKEKVIKMFQEFEFVSLLKRVPGMADVATEQKNKKTALRIKNFSFLKNPEAADVKKIAAQIKKNGSYGARAVIEGGLSERGLSGLIIVTDGDGCFIKKELLDELKEVFFDEKIVLAGHDLKQLFKALLVEGVEIRNKYFDAMVGSYLLNPGSRSHDPSSIILRFLGKELPVASSQAGLFGVDVERLAQELFWITQTVEKIKNELVKTEDLGLLEKIEMPLEKVLAKMENNGVAVDVKTLGKLANEVNADIKKVTDKIYKMAGVEFNISSPIQLREVLFEKLEIPVEGIKKGKTGLSTGAEQLEKMRGLHPIINEIESYRELTKLKNTYIDVLPNLINKKTGRIHANFNQAVTATGRLSSSDPNLQNIPIRTALGREVRKAFVAEEGNVLVSADYSQIELRIVASLAEDKKMIEIFEKGEDIHRATAAVINGVPLDKVTKEMRRAAKEINFGVLYGMGVYGLSWRAEISQNEARDFIKKYFEQFSGVKKYIDRTLEFTKKEGYCETLFGRRRYIPELNSSNFQLRSAAERMAINHPIQGTAADLIKMAMIEVDKEIAKYNTEEAKMILQVHDELVFEVKKSLVPEISKILERAMENVVKLRVPIKVEVYAEKNWGDIK